MSKKKNILAYRNEDDRCYGLAGMAISLATLDAIDRVVEISIDAKGPMVTFSNEFFWGSSQSASPKASWQRLMQNYQITTSLALANVLSRCLIRDKGSDPAEMLAELMPVIKAEGREVCELEDDEIHNFYDNTLMRANRIFSNRRIYPVVDELARILARRRTLSGREIAEELHYLRLI
jgi:hypothetical protein